MKKPLALLAFFCISATAQNPQPGYQDCTTISVVGRHPSGGSNVFGFNTASQWGPWQSPNTWQSADITTNPNLVGITGVKAVQLAGFAIITNPMSGFTANVTAAFVAPGQEGYGFTCQDYSIQAVQDGYGGIRQPFNIWVPVINNKFDWCWNSYYNASVGYEITGAVNAYCR